jgi:spermidine synthase
MSPKHERESERAVPYRWVLLLFFVSGASSLIYQVVWVRMLVLVFGTSVFAVSTVLAAFMAGLALGSAWFGRRIDRQSDALRVYAWLELGIGLFALAFPLLLGPLDGLCTLLYRALGGNGTLFGLARFLVCFVVLLVPTTLMGGTLPVLGKYVVPSVGRLGRRMGALYAWNTFGATIGCAAAAFVLIERLGTRETTWFAAGANLLIGAAALALARRYPQTASVRAPARDAEPVALAPGRLERIVLVGFALSGFAALGYEIVWIRLLTTLLQVTTVQSVSTIVISFLLGLALGGGVGARWADRWRALPAMFGGIELLLGLFGLASIAALAALPALAAFAGPAPTWLGHVLRLFVSCLAIMLAPTFLMGLLFPVAARTYVRELASLGGSVGRVYAANTAGAIGGAFFTGFVLVPLVGTQGAVTVLAAVNIGVGLAVLAVAPAPRGRAKLALVGGIVLPALLLVLALPARHLAEVLRRSEPGGELLFWDEGTAGTVTVFGFPDGGRLLKVNGAGEVPTDLDSIRTFRLLGSLPMLLHPAPRDVVVIAFGGGITLSTVELYRPQHLDCVELAPGVFEGARLFAKYNFDLGARLDRPPLELIVDDGRNHLLRSSKRYDVIISDATHPATADSWLLYTREFYELCRRRLESGGMVAQWLPLHGLTSDDHRMIVRTFAGVFPHATLWLTRGYTVMLGTTEPLVIDEAEVARRVEDPDVRGALGEVDLGDATSLLGALALDARAVASYAGAGAINTDNRPHIGFGDRTRAGMTAGVQALAGLAPQLVEWLPADVLRASPEQQERLARRLLARKHTYYGEIAMRLGQRDRALELLGRARATDPDERQATRLLEGLRSSGSSQ